MIFYQKEVDKAYFQYDISYEALKYLPRRRVYIYQKELHKACSQNYMAYGDFNYLSRRRVSDEVLRHKAFDFSKNPKYDGYQLGISSAVY